VGKTIRERLMAIGADELREASGNLNQSDLSQLVELLSEKDDRVRYQALLMLQNRSALFDDVYPFWDVFREKLMNENSYQRSIGLLLIADNVRWDKDGRFDRVVDRYLSLLGDEKPITIRQCIQALGRIVPHKKHLQGKIAAAIMAIDIASIRETMRKSVLLDILGVLAVARRQGETSNQIEEYIADALSGSVLDRKAMKQVEAML
jgi:hypothetical protein